jgi:hypothetical protein
MKNLIEKIKSKFSKKNDENNETNEENETKMSKKTKIIIASGVALFIAIIIIINTVNQRRLSVLNNEIKFSDVKNITITRIDKSKTFVDKATMKNIYFLLYRYGKNSHRVVVKDFELKDEETVILNINQQYDIYLYKDEGSYYMGYINYGAYKITDSDYNEIVSYLDEDDSNGK